MSLHLTERDMRPLGSGFLIDSWRVLTCAHVAEAAWNKHAELWAAFPKAEEAMGRRVRISEVTLPPADDHEVQDAAVLRLAEAVPAGLAARLRRPAAQDLVGADWWSFGFPDGVLGNSASGTVGEALGYGWMRLDTLEPRYPVKGGYSGAAVWSPAYQAVVGMVGQAHNATGDARALTVRAIDRMLPDQELHRLIDWSLEAADETALTSWGWYLGTDPEAGRHWHPRARGVSTEAERGFRFRGRAAALREITQWITAGPPRRQVLVVTGAPGSGKSAVLGRIITTADREVAASLPPDDTAIRAPLGAVSCAVHAKGKTALEVAQEIARAASAPLPGQVIDLLPSLRASLEDRPGRPFTVVVDALDEASTAEEARAIVNRIMVPLAETCADLRVRVVVGARRRDDAGDLLGAFGRTARIVDLDAPEFTALADLTAYALATLQLQGDERSSSPYADSAVARPVAERIAALADGNFLVAGLVARAHGIHDEQAVDPSRMSFPVTVDSSLREYLTLLPDISGLPAESLLTPLAYAEAPGLTMALWRTALTALFGAAPAGNELFAFARSSAANFLVETTATGGPDDVTFRLFHQALSDSLRAARADVASFISDERALACAYITEGAKVGWAVAPVYLLRSLAVHAGRGGVIDQLLEEDEYPLYADLRRLIPQARLAVTDKGRQRARLLRQTPRAIDAPASERAALFSVAEVQEHLGTTYCASVIAGPYQAVWSTVPPSMEVAVLEGHSKQVQALCSLQSGGRGLLASVGDDAIRLWDPDTGDTIRTLTGYSGWVGALCAVETDSRTFLAGAGQDGVLRLWAPETGKCVRTLEGHDAPIDQLCAVNIDGRALLASRGRDRRVRVWDPDSGKVVRTFRARSHKINGLCAVGLGGRALLALLTGHSGGRSMVRLWDPATGETVRTFLTRSSSLGHLAAVPYEGSLLLATSETVGDNDVVALWDPSTGRTVRVLEGGPGSIYDLVDVRIGDRTLVAAGYGQEESGTVVLWDPVTGRETHRLEGHDGWVGALCTVELSGETLVASAGGDCTVRLWDLDRCAELDQFGELGAGIGSLCVLEVNGRTAVASSGTAAKVLIHEVATGRLIGQISTLHASVKSFCSVEIEGRACLAIASRGRAGGAIQVWDPTTGGATRSLVGPEVGSLCAAEINGRPCLAFASRDEKVDRVSLWDLSADEVIRSIASDGGLIRDLCTLDVEGCHLIAVLTGHFGIWPGEFNGGVVSLWDPASGEMADSLEIPDANFGSLCALDADDRTLLAVTRHQSDDEDDQVGTGSVWVVDPAIGRRVGVQELHNGWVNSVSPVEFGARTRMASAGQTERSVRLWTADDLRQTMEIPVRREVFSVVQADDHLVFGLDNGGVMAVRLTSAPGLHG
ncbi:AAA family ATPase [Streptomyces rimosus]|uniref:AAA family ATPase n=1 Tax=Streptomyces rimosus TaxID=1927 RepID=UPI00067C3F83|nr:trypsin-like peptidase domain-containing protein [Streptomyces rimosus]